MLTTTAMRKLPGVDSNKYLSSHAVGQIRLRKAKHSAALHFLALPAGNLTHSKALWLIF